MGRKRRKCTVDLKLLIEQTILAECESNNVKYFLETPLTPNKRAEVRTCHGIIENDSAEIVVDVSESDLQSSSCDSSCQQADTTTEDLGE